MKRLISPSRIEGRVEAPASKSMMQRAVAAALLAEGKTVLYHPSFCNDALSALRVSEQLGASIQRGDSTVTVEGGGVPGGNTLNCGESGLGIRMFTAIAALNGNSITLTGEGSLLKRPMDSVIRPLQDLGVEVHTCNGFIPITVRGPLQGGETRVDGSVSSQFLTGLLMALPRARDDSRLTVENLKSRPYIDLTLRVLNGFGVRVDNRHYEQFDIMGNQKYRAREYIIEGDWSGAAFLLTAAAIAGRVEVGNLDPCSDQADRVILDALQQAGAGVEMNAGSVIVRKKRLIPFSFDATDCPDLFPPLAALAAHCPGESEIKGVSRLIHKESNRAAVLREEFGRIGITILLEGDRMLIRGGTVKSGTMDSHNDHRIAMAAAVAGLAAAGKVEINGCQAVCKSYPDFFRDIARLGVEVHE